MRLRTASSGIDASGRTTPSVRDRPCVYGADVPDPIYAEPQLARAYDSFDGHRGDLDPYLRIVGELGARHVLDVGCGTGSFAAMLAQHGYRVTGIDPAAASLEIAKAKP